MCGLGGWVRSKMDWERQPGAPCISRRLISPKRKNCKIGPEKPQGESPITSNYKKITNYVTLKAMRKVIKGSKDWMRSQRLTKRIPVLLCVTQLKLPRTVMSKRKKTWMCRGCNDSVVVKVLTNGHLYSEALTEKNFGNEEAVAGAYHLWSSRGLWR